MDDGIVVRSCRAEGCEHATAVLRGRYGGLCTEHRAELASQIREEHQAKAEGRTPSSGASTNGNASAISLEARARALVTAAKRLDTSVSRHRASRAELREAVAQFNGTLKALQADANALLQAPAATR